MEVQGRGAEGELAFYPGRVVRVHNRHFFEIQADLSCELAADRVTCFSFSLFHYSCCYSFLLILTRQASIQSASANLKTLNYIGLNSRLITWKNYLSITTNHISLNTGNLQLWTSGTRMLLSTISPIQ